MNSRVFFFGSQNVTDEDRDRRLENIEAGIFIGSCWKIVCIYGMKHLSIHINRLTNSLRNAVTGDAFDTELHRITAKDKPLLKNYWLFDWWKELKNRETEVWKLVIVHNPT